MSAEKVRGAEKSAPQITTEQIEALGVRFAALRGEPIETIGATSVCPDCGGEMTVVNDLERSVAVPGVVFVVSRLPGARCATCAATQLDASGLGILESTIPKEIIADYETAVTHSSGATLGTYFKMDLARVLKLVGNERLLWKVVDRDHALVRVARQSREHRPARRGRSRIEDHPPRPLAEEPSRTSKRALKA